MTRFGFGLEKIGLLCLKRPLLSLAVVAITCLIALYGLTRLTFDGDPGQVFRADNEVSRATDRQSAAFPFNGQQLVLLIESAKPYTARQLEAIRALHLEMQFIEGVTGVSSIFSARIKIDENGNTPTVLPADMPPENEIPALLSKLYAHPLIADLMFARDLTTSMMIISFKANTGGLAGMEKSLNDVGQLTALVGPAAHLDVTQTGVMAIRYDVLKSLNQDVHKLNVAGAALAILICFIFFRNMRYVLIVSIPPVIAVLWLLGMFGLTERPVTAMNNVLPTLVLVIAFCDALHMMQSIRRGLALGMEVKEAVRRSVIDVGPACAMTSLTTMVACASLTLSSSNAVREFGAAGAISVFFAFIAVIALVPAISVLVLKAGKTTQSHPDRFNAALDRFSIYIWHLVQNRAKAISVISLMALIVSSYAYFSITTNYNYRNFLSQGSPANLAIDKIDEKFGGADVFNILVETKTPSIAPPPALVAAHRKLENLKGVRTVFSFVTALDWLGAIDTSNQAAVDKVIDRLPTGFRSRIVSSDNKTWLMTVYIPNNASAQTRKSLDKMEQELAPVRKAFPDTKLSISGGIARSAYSSPLVIGGLKFSLAVAVLITILMVGIFVRSMKYALLSAVPNLLPLTLVAAGLYFTGNTFSLIGVLALTIAFGIAIDNTIHVVNRLQIERQGRSIGEALSITISKTGPVLFAATLLLSSGLFVTRLSQLPSIRLFGVYMSVVLVIALFAAIIVLPSLILLSERSKEKPKEGADEN